MASLSCTTPEAKPVELHDKNMQEHAMYARTYKHTYIYVFNKCLPLSLSLSLLSLSLFLCSFFALTLSRSFQLRFEAHVFQAVRV